MCKPRLAPWGRRKALLPHPDQTYHSVASPSNAEADGFPQILRFATTSAACPRLPFSDAPKAPLCIREGGKPPTTLPAAKFALAPQVTEGLVIATTSAARRVSPLSLHSALCVILSSGRLAAQVEPEGRRAATGSIPPFAPPSLVFERDLSRF